MLHRVMKKIKKQISSGGTKYNHNNFLVSLAGIAYKLDKVGPTFSSFNHFSSLLSVATDDRKQFHCLNRVRLELTKLDHYFLN